MGSLQNILVPVDFGDSSRAALDVAIDLSKRFDSELTLIHAWEIPVHGYAGIPIAVREKVTPLRDLTRARLDAVLAEVRRERPNARAILAQGVPWREILSAIELLRPMRVVMGAHGHGERGGSLLGNVAEKIVRMSPSPVLTVRSNDGGWRRPDAEAAESRPSAGNQVDAAAPTTHAPFRSVRRYGALSSTVSGAMHSRERFVRGESRAVGVGGVARPAESRRDVRSGR